MTSRCGDDAARPLYTYVPPGDDEIEFDGAVGVEADGHELRVRREEVLDLAALLAQRHRRQTLQLSRLSHRQTLAQSMTAHRGVFRWGKVKKSDNTHTSLSQRLKKVTADVNTSSS